MKRQNTSITDFFKNPSSKSKTIIKKNEVDNDNNKDIDDPGVPVTLEESPPIKKQKMWCHKNTIVKLQVLQCWYCSNGIVLAWFCKLNLGLGLASTSAILVLVLQQEYFIPTEWIQPTNEDCKYGANKCYDKEKETTTTTIFGLLSKKKRWGQERHMSETTMSNVEEQLEKSKKWKLQQKILEMESDRLKAILDILNSQ
ncbi:hypothetical protein QTP88_005314 [Uroleucon formosanum]